MVAKNKADRSGKQKASARTVKPERPVVMRQFVVYGRPQPQGSTRSFVKGNRVVTTSANKNLKPWRQQVSETLMYEVGSFTGDGKETVALAMSFYFQKPKSANRKHMTVKPDLDKLVRGILDSGTGVLYKDDSQVNVMSATKDYGSPERVEISMVRQ